MTDSASVVFVGDDDASIRESLKNLLRTAIEQAGAERGVLVLSRWTEPQIAAQATTGDGGIVVKLEDEAMTPAVLPESVIQYVVRTNESVILDDAAAQNPFSADPYIRQQHARSILCLPFLNQGQLIGVLYLENNLTPGVFAPARIAVLKLLASQAAISLENARLYRDLAEREAKIRRLVEGQTPQAEDELRAIIDNAPVFLWSDLPDGFCDFLNQRWLTYFNLSLQEAQGAGWATLLHPDDAAHHLESWQKSVATGIPFETEARFRSPDGEYRWFLTRANPLRDKAGRIVKWYGTNIDIENLKRTERRLRQSEANLAEAQRLSHTGSWALSPATTKILYWSEECYRIWGFDPVQGLPNRETVWRRIHPGDRDRMYKETQEALREKRDYNIDFRIVLPDATVKYLEAIGHHLFSEHGELVQIVGTNVDVTERKRAEEALRESETKIRRLVNANIIGIVIWDFEGRVIEANDAFLRMVDYDREDLVSGRIRWTELTPPEWLDRDARRWLPELKVTGSLQPFEKEYFRKDGSRVPVLIGAATFEEGGNQGVAFVLDLTERKRAEEELRRSEAYLAEAEGLTHTGSWAWSPVTGNISYWSEECYRVLGFDPAGPPPRFETFFQNIHPDDQASSMERFQKAIRENADFEMDYRIVHPDGEIRNIHVVGHPTLGPSGDLREFVGTVMDVTDRKLAEETLRKTQTELAHVARVATVGELTASIAHEINQPLGALVNNAGACLGWLDAGNLEEARNSVALVMGDAQRASEIITGIRALVKKAPPQKDWLDINQIIREVIGLGQSEVQRNHIALETQLSDDMPLVFADRIQLQQVMLNLMMNAIEAMTQVTGPRELLISSGLDDSKGAVVVVRDSGTGLDSKSLEHLFEPFYTTKPQGMGMGLTICRSIIEAHGGRLWATANDGRGATFQFTLLQDPQRDPDVPRTSPSNEHPQ